MHIASEIVTPMRGDGHLLEHDDTDFEAGYGDEDDDPAEDVNWVNHSFYIGRWRGLAD